MTVVSEPSHPAAESPPRPPWAAEAPLADLARLVRDHQAGVWRYLRYLGAEASEADDLTQETFLALARSAFAESSPAETTRYLRTVARRRLLMLRRTQSRRIATVELDAADAVWGEAFDTPHPSGEDPWDLRLDAARGCVEKLDARPRQAIDLAYRESLGREAIAARLGMVPDGVKTLLRRTRAALRGCIEQTLARAAIGPSEPR